jgi:hypothetical protein
LVRSTVDLGQAILLAAVRVRTMSIPAVLVFAATDKVDNALIRRRLPDHRGGRLKLITPAPRPEAAWGFETQGIETRQIDGSVPALYEVYDNVLSLTGREPTSFLTLLEGRSSFDSAPVQ